MKQYLKVGIPSSKIGKILAAASICVVLAASQTGADQRIEKEYIAAGIFETGLAPEIPEDANCPEIALGFGSRYNRSGNLRKASHGLFHAGVDWALPEGTPIVAISDGKVIAKQKDRPGSAPGNHLIIRHYPRTDNISSSYVHLSGFNVDEKEEVKKGQVIGFVGKTGTGVTFTHLHLNIYAKEKVQVGDRTWRYRYDFLQLLSGDMQPIDPVKKRDRKVKVAYMDQFGKVHPSGAKVIWPFI